MMSAKYNAEDRLRVTLIESGTSNGNGLSTILTDKTFSCDIKSLLTYDIANKLYPMEAIVNNYDVAIDVDNTWFYVVHDLETGEETVIWDDIIQHDKTTYLKETYEFVVTIKDTSGNRGLTMLDEVQDALTTGISQVIINVVHKDPTVEDPLVILETESSQLKDILQNVKDLEISNIPAADIKKNMDAINSTMSDLSKSISVLAARANIENVTT